MRTGRCALVIVVVALAVAACGGEGKEYSPEVERGYAEQCFDVAVADGEQGLNDSEATEYCSCTYAKIQATVPYATYDDWARGDAPLPPRMAAIASTCLVLQGYTAGTEKSFVAECVKSTVAGTDMVEAEAHEFCACSFLEIKATVPFADFVDFYERAEKDPSTAPPTEVVAAVERCTASAG